jgi:hypothetical protein
MEQRGLDQLPVTLYARSPKVSSIGIDVFIVRDLRSLNAKKCKAPHRVTCVLFYPDGVVIASS